MLPYQPPQLSVSSPATEEAAQWSKLLQQEMNAKLNLAYQGLDHVPEKVLRKYANKLKELDLTRNSVRWAGQ